MGKAEHVNITHPFWDDVENVSILEPVSWTSQAANFVVIGLDNISSCGRKIL